MNKITIIGAGSVGSTIAYTLAVMDLATEHRHDRHQPREGAGRSAGHPPGHAVLRARLDLCRQLSGRGRTPTSSSSPPAWRASPASRRLDLAQTNVNIMKTHHPGGHQVCARRHLHHRQQPGRYPDLCIHASAPACRRTTSSVPAPSWTPPVCVRACPSTIPSASSNVHAYVFGEHGDSSFVPWSLANISNIPIDDYRRLHVDRRHVHAAARPSKMSRTYIRKSGGRIIARKGATFYAVAVSVCHICKCLLQRHRHHDDRLLHDARRIRHRRRMPVHR